MRRMLLAALLVTGVALSVGSQGAGDAVVFVQPVGGPTHLLAVTPSGLVQTLFTRPVTSRLDGLAVGPANVGCVFAETDTISGAIRILAYQAGGPTTLATMPRSFLFVPSLDVDQDGSILVLSQVGPDRGLYRMPATGGPLTTVVHNRTAGTLANLYAMELDPHTGERLLLDLNGLIHSVDRRGTVTGTSYALPSINPWFTRGNAHVDYRTGRLQLALGYTLLDLDHRTGAVSTVFTVAGPFFQVFSGVDADPYLGGSYVSLRNVRTVGDSVARYDSRLRTLTTVAVVPFVSTPGDVISWQSRMLSGTTRPVRGGTYTIILRIPTEGGRPYAAAAALGSLRGIPVGGRRIPLDPDPLFAVSTRSPAVFSGFRGTLTASGIGSLAIRIPSNASVVGFRFLVAAITYGPAGVRVISEPLDVTIE